MGNGWPTLRFRTDAKDRASVHTLKDTDVWFPRFVDQAYVKTGSKPVAVYLHPEIRKLFDGDEFVPCISVVPSNHGALPLLANDAVPLECASVATHRTAVLFSLLDGEHIDPLAKHRKAGKA